MWIYEFPPGSANAIDVHHVWGLLGSWQNTFVTVVSKFDERAESAAVGGEFTLILTSSGRVYGCGSNEFGQLGLGNGVIETDRPERLDDLSSVRSISAGRDFSLITASDGLYVMGDNTYGTLT